MVWNLEAFGPMQGLHVRDRQSSAPASVIDKDWEWNRALVTPSQTLGTPSEFKLHVELQRQIS